MLNNFHLTSWIAVFVGLVVLDIIWVGYTKSLQKHTPVKSGLWAAIMITVSGFVTISYVGDHSLLIPAAAGAFVGTWSGANAHSYFAKIFGVKS
jgi:hypothetical protein